MVIPMYWDEAVTFWSPGEKQGLGSSDHMVEVFEKKIERGPRQFWKFLGISKSFQYIFGFPGCRTT